MTLADDGPAARAPHFVQTAGQPVFTGQGNGVLTCRRCESVLVRGYDPRNFLTIDFQCAACGAVTTTPGLSALNAPPAAMTVLERTAEILPEGASIRPGQVLAGREELDRLMHIYQPHGPRSDTVTVAPDWLDGVAADYDRLTSGALSAHLDAVTSAEATKPFSGFTPYPLAWSLWMLRAGVARPDWDCTVADADSVATTTAAAFRYFLDCWSHHPLFPEMVAAAADTRFSLHGLALFASAKALSDSGNRIAFTPPADGSGKMRDFAIAMGPADRLTCVVDAFDQFEWPGRHTKWDFPSLRAALMDRMLASKSRIHLRRPGMIVLSPGATQESMEQPLVDAIHSVFHTHGRRYRPVSAVSAMVAKIQRTFERNTVQFGYSFLPVPNPWHATVTVKVNEPNAPTR